MNYKVLKRPMFRIGGGVDSQGTGITSGMDTPKRGLVTGPGSYQGKGYDEYLESIPGLLEELGSGYGKMKEQLGPLTLMKIAQSGALKNVGSLWDLPQAIGSSEALGATMEGLTMLPKIELKEKEHELTTATTMAKLLKPKDNAYMYRHRLQDARDLRKKIKDYRATVPKDQWDEDLVQGWEDDISYLLGTDTLEEFLIQASISQGVLFDRESSVDHWYEIKGLEKKAEGGIVGRKNYQEGVGPNIMGEGQNVMQEEGAAVMEQGMQPPVQEGPPGQQDPYQILRQRLPAEVPDEVVRLIAYNKEAFQDFANIQTQDDITAFNDKYGVSLVIDVGSV